MCGIAGVLKFDASDEVNEQMLVRMRDSLHHRGPDGAGIMVEGRIGLAHRRLSIIDLAGGRQPMANVSRRCWITYNGEIYNYKALRAKLITMGRQFVTESDTEVVLAAYEVFGPTCVDHLDGMFAFAVWDGDAQKLFLARDRMGIKPLYYAITDDGISFGSEIKALIASGSIPVDFNAEVLPEYLANRFIAGADTFFSGISKLLPGHTLSWCAEEGFQGRRYWQLPPTDDNSDLSRIDYVDKVREGLKKAVRSHLVSDVPVGLFLSGGLDSTALASIMSTMVDGPVHTFSVGFSEAEANELSFAREAADAVGAEHAEVVVDPAQFFSLLPSLIWHEDEPVAFTSSVPLHILSRLASEQVKVVLTGEGADELFIGYDYRYRVTALNQRYGRNFAAVCPAALQRRIAAGIPHLPARLRRYAERSFLALGTQPRDIFCENFSVFRQQHRDNILPAALPASPADNARDPHEKTMSFFEAAGDDVVQSMSHADLQTYLVELLMKQDQMSMSASIESRVPFLDHHLVELVSAIPARFKLQGLRTKALLRDAVADMIPESILKRKKMGFPVPLGRWLRGQYWPLVEDIVLGKRTLARGLFDPAAAAKLAHDHRQGRADNAERLWLLINMEIWQRIFIDGDSPSDIFAGKAYLRARELPDVMEKSLPSLS